MHLSANCSVMAALVIRHGPCAIFDRNFQPFETLAGSIIGQQLSVASWYLWQHLDAAPIE